MAEDGRGLLELWPVYVHADSKQILRSCIERIDRYGS